MKSVFGIILLLFYSAVPAADNVLTRFKTPAGYAQEKVASGSFAQWLQNLPLKPVGTRTKTYKGTVALTECIQPPL